MFRKSLRKLSKFKGPIRPLFAMLIVLPVITLATLELEYFPKEQKDNAAIAWFIYPYSILITITAVLYAIFSIMKTAESLFAQRMTASPQLSKYLSPRRMTPKETVLAAITSYLLTIYAFALLYETIASTNPNRFNALIDLHSSLYFSVVTIATVGYGDILANGRLARVIVSAEILVGVGYQVFFFSVIAGLIRQRPGAKRDTSNNRFSRPRKKRRTRHGGHA